MTDPNTEPNTEQAAYWEELAPSWLAGEQHSEKVSQRFGRLAMERLHLQPGHRVLDIACGSGLTTLELAALVGHDGQADGVDIAPALVAAARQRAGDAHVGNARFTVADVQTDDLGEGYDAAFSRFGVMFFADPVTAFARIRGALRPGAPFAFAAWQNLFANEWMFVPGSAVVAVTGVLPPMPGPGEPGPFSLAEPGRIEELLAGAGFADVEVDTVDETIVLPADDIGSLVDLSSRVGPVREALRTADAATSERILAAVRDAIDAKVADGEVRLTAGAFVARARA
jgi:SAM-dependent methyltransferase